MPPNTKERSYGLWLSSCIAATIKKSGRSCESIAREIGVHPNTVRMWTNEKTPLVPSAWNLANLCKALDVSADKLLGLR